MGRGVRLGAIVALFAALNVAGWVWTRGEVRAAGDDEVRVRRAWPEQADGASELALDFDRPLVGVHEVGQPLLRLPMLIEPPLAGGWQWAAPDRLVFLPSEPLPPGRLLRIRPSPQFEALTGLDLEGSQEFVFRTRALHVRACTLEAVDADGVLIALRFNQPVAGADVAEHLEVEGAGGSSRVEVVQAQASDQVLLRLPPTDGETVKVRLRAGLRGPGADLGLGRDYATSVALQRSFRLLSTEAYQPYGTDRLELALHFSTLLDPAQSLPAVASEPPVEGLSARVDGTRLRVEGDFAAGRSYQLRLEAPLLARNGAVLEAGATGEATLPRLRPAVRMPFHHGFLSPRGHLELDLEVVNVPGVRVRAWRVHSNNLVALVRGEGLRETARELPVVELPLQLEPDVPAEVALDLRALTGGLPGVWRIEARASDDRWLDDRALVTVTDLGLVARREREGLLAWVVSLETGEPVEGAAVESWSYNGQLLAGAVTGPDGCARLDVLPDHPDGAPYLVRAVAGDDVTFLPAAAFGLEAGDLDVSGRAPTDGLDVLLYAARDVHRPGDEVHLTGIVREADGALPASTALLLRGRRPDGRAIAPVAVRATSDGQGLFQVAVPTREEDPTGPWTFRVTPTGEDRSLGRATVLVEPFVPVRIEVAAHAERELVVAPQAPAVEVEAAYLIGRPAEDLRVTLAGRLEPRAFRSTRHPGFRFEGPEGRAPVQVAEVEARLDDAGRARLEVELPPGLAASYTAELSATVREEGARSVSAQVDLVLDTAPRHLGLRVPDGPNVRPGAPFQVEWVQVDCEDAPAPASATLELVRLERRWELRTVDGRMVWTRVADEIGIARHELTPGAGEVGRLELTCPQAGNYALVATDGETGLVTRLELGAWSGDLARLPGSAPDRVVVALDHERYRPGETARVHLQTPFAGQLLLTLEGETLLHHRVVAVPEGASTLELALPEGLRGGAFVAVDLVRALRRTGSSWEAHRARGLARLVADHEQRRLAVALDAPAEAAPAGRVRVGVDVGAPRDPARPPRVHLWAVDEGILLAGGTRTPDPFEHFLGPRRASIETAQTWGELLPDAERPRSVQRIGGDAEADEALRRRRGALPTRKREAAVIVLAAQPVGPDGRLEVELDLPDLTGALRLMAVAVDGDAYGASEQRMLLTAPLTVEASWPRCAAPGDTFEVPITLLNQSDEELAVQVAIEGPLAPTEPLRPVRLAPGGRAQLRARARPTRPELAGMLVRASAQLASGETVEARARADVQVRHAALLHSETRWLRGEAGETLTLAPEARFEREGLRVDVWVGARPRVELEPVLRELIDYPYGCVEQTTSRLFGLLYAVRLGDEASAAADELARAQAYLQAGLVRLQTMQTASGGLAYWPGGSDPQPWGSAYAAGFLARAQRELARAELGSPRAELGSPRAELGSPRAELAGFELDRPFVDALLDYLERELPRSAEQPSLQAEVCAALAAFQRPDESWMAYLTERRDRLDVAARARLARAWLEAGRRDRALETIGSDSLRLSTRRTTGGRLVSSVSADAALLEALLELDPEHPWVVTLVERLGAARAAGGWSTTLSQASGLAALSAYQELTLAESHFEGELRSADGESWTLTSAAPLRLQLDEPALPLVIETRGEGPVFAALTAEGFAAGAVEAYDRGLAARRRWLTPEGEELDLNRPLRSGELVLCEITLTTQAPTEASGVHNVAVVDALPGGLEVESPRLATSARTGHGGDTPDRVEFGDDRVLLFSSASSRTRTFVYALRAVAVGEFALPPLQAGCMYDPEVASVHGGGTLRVEP